MRFPTGSSARGIPFYVLIIVAVVLAQVLILLALGRSWTCDCGSFLLWQAAMDRDENSQHFADPYSLLHVVFGAGLFLWLRLIRPRWSLAARAAIAIVCSAIWEVVENLPPIIRGFADQGSNLHYSGDSIVNSLGDTLFVFVGFLLASKLPARLVIAGAVVVEIAVYALIGDGFVAGAIRFATHS